MSTGLKVDRLFIQAHRKKSLSSLILKLDENYFLLNVPQFWLNCVHWGVCFHNSVCVCLFSMWVLRAHWQTWSLLVKTIEQQEEFARKESGERKMLAERPVQESFIHSFKV